jgi:hypothetical protein
VHQRRHLLERRSLWQQEHGPSSLQSSMALSQKILPPGYYKLRKSFHHHSQVRHMLIYISTSDLLDRNCQKTYDAGKNRDDFVCYFEMAFEIN